MEGCVKVIADLVSAARLKAGLDPSTPLEALVSNFITPSDY